MKRKIFMLMLIATSITLSATAQEKDLIARQKKQEKVIEQAYKKKKISELEYNKLMHEQEVIKQTIEKFAADDVWTAKKKMPCTINYNVLTNASAAIKLMGKCIKEKPFHPLV